MPGVSVCAIKRLAYFRAGDVVRSSLCIELLKVSGRRVLAKVLDKRTYFAGDLGGSAGIPGLRKRLTATFIGSRI